MDGAALGCHHRSAIGEPLTGHTGSVCAVARSPPLDGRPALATAGDDGTVRLLGCHHRHADR